MSQASTEIIVLRTRRYSESSLVAVLLSREYGRMDVLAKGARREKSPLFGHLDLYARENALILRRPQAGLDLLLEAAFTDEHPGLRFSPPAFAAAGFLADLAAEATLPGEPVPELFDVLANALRVLSDLGGAAGRAGLTEREAFSPADAETLIGRTFKLAVLDMLGWLGYGLELNRCVLCGTAPPADRAAFLSALQGGLVCASCRPKARGTVRVIPFALAGLRERGAEAERRELSLPPNERKRLLRFLADYAQHALERPLRGRRVLRQILGV